MKKLTNEEFIEKAKEKHDDKYNYSLVEYDGNRKKVKIICTIHGIFEQTPDCHYNRGCDKCGGTATNTTEEFIEKSKEIHGDKYDYSLVEYDGNRNKVKIICPIHGIFEQTPSNHINNKSECTKCSNLIKSEKIKLTTEEFIEKSKEIHGDKYDYCLVKYINSNKKVKIICPTHGMFEQKPNSHLNGRGCGKCFGRNLTKEELINDFNKIHNNKYNYSLIDYKSKIDKIDIICGIHGIFKQSSSAHLRGNGCPMCKESKGEKIIVNFLKTKNIKYKYQMTFKDCKYKNILRFDFYLPNYNICIEYDGIQHFKEIKYFGGMKRLEEQKIKDDLKTEYCKNNSICLIRIKYDEDIIKKLTETLVFQNIDNTQTQ